MTFFRRIGWLCCLTAALLLCAASGGAEEIRVETRGLELTDEVSVWYPAVAGLADPELQEKINTQILEDCRIQDYLARATALLSGGSLRVEWTGGILGDVFSCAVSALGAVETSRTTHVWTRSVVDLRDGHEIAFEELFTDAEAARDLIETYLDETVAADLSAMALNCELVPMPEAFVPETVGLTLLYPVSRLTTLDDRAGDVRIPWSVLRPVLNLEEDSILCRIGADRMITLSEESARELRAEAAAGSLPGIPAAIGDSMQELTDRYHLLTDPDGYEDGRLFSLEGGCFRGVYLQTDDLSRSWENSRVQGIRMDQGCAWGLCVGETDRAAWLSVLGEPEHTAEIGEEKAEAFRLVPGTCDYYECGSCQLRLYSDGDEKLISVVLTE